MSKKTYLLIGVIIVLIIVAIIVFKSGKGNEKQGNSVNNVNTVTTNATTNTITNTITNVIANEVTGGNTIKNETTNQVKNNTVNNSTGATIPPQSEALTESQENLEAKAISIVKEDWVNNVDSNQTVEFTVEGIDENGRYMIGVRNANTTQALAFYTVNTADGTFSKKAGR